MSTKTKKPVEKGGQTAAKAGDKTQKPTPKEKSPKVKAAAPESSTTTPEDGEKRVSKMSVEELRAKYAEIVGRETKSTNRGYLVWRVQQAMKGKIQAGPLAGRSNVGPSKVLPVRVPESAVAPLGEVQKRLGIRSRNEMLHQAIAAFLVNAGESDLAKQFGEPVSAEQ